MSYPSTANDIELGINMMAAAYKDTCTAKAFDNKTNSLNMPPRSYSYLKIGKGEGSGRPAMLAIAGLHAREWAQPDAVMSFAINLLQAYNAGTPFTIPVYTDATGTVYGPVSVPVSTVKTIIENMDLYLLPLANPDGREYDMNNPAIDPGKYGWRKNRSPNPDPTDTNPMAVGVDINRNFALGWDLNTFYSPAAAQDPTLTDNTSTVKSSYQYEGTPAFSEIETQNIKWLLDNLPITYFVDLHSYRQLVMHSWGVSKVQTSDTGQNFQNKAYDQKRDFKDNRTSLLTPGATYDASGTFSLTIESGLAYNLVSGTNDKKWSLDNSDWSLLFQNNAITTANTATTLFLNGKPNSPVTVKVYLAYREFFPNDAPDSLFERHDTAVKAISANIFNATGAQYTVGTPGDLYPCSGTSTDYVFSRQFLSSGAPTMYAFGVEFGNTKEGFKPTPAQYPKIEREVHATLLTLAGYVALWEGFL